MIYFPANSLGVLFYLKIIESFPIRIIFFFLHIIINQPGDQISRTTWSPLDHHLWIVSKSTHNYLPHKLSQPTITFIHFLDYNQGNSSLIRVNSNTSILWNWILLLKKKKRETYFTFVCFNTRQYSTKDIHLFLPTNTNLVLN